MTQREKNKVIFQDTEERCKQHAVLRKAIETSGEQQKIYKENELITAITDAMKKRRTNIVVSPKCSVEAAIVYKGKNVCVHNFASATNPGGGMVRGSNAFM